MPAKKAVAPLRKSSPRKKPSAPGSRRADISPKTPKPRAGVGVDLRPGRITAIFEGLRRAYPDAECALLHSNPWELLVATILSAQCTDARVNLVTPILFAQFPSPAHLAEAPLLELQEIIRPTGFYRNKSKSITGAAKVLLRDFGGEVPRTMDELLTVPGAARKTANVVLGVAYGIAEGIVVDTHVLRLSRRLQLTVNTDPVKVEQDLVQIVPRDHWIAFSHELILHGRQVCMARKPRCVDCAVERECNSLDKTWSSH